MPYLSIPADELVQTAAASPLPLHLQQAEVYSYDTAEYPFAESVAAMLRCEEGELGQLHTTPAGVACLASGEARGNMKRRKDHFIKLWRASGNNKLAHSEARERYNAVLRRFVDIFVAPKMCTEGEAPPALAYQRDAVLRVVLPHCNRVTDLHCDADYHHPPAEVNWWVPLVDVDASNTLYVESVPGKGDFQPVELKYGQVLRFYGNLCQHYALPNVSNSTRISFDLRVLSLDHHHDHWRDHEGKPCRHIVGQYYIRAGEEGDKIKPFASGDHPKAEEEEEGEEGELPEELPELALGNDGGLDDY
jgi:hypothetical protein